MRTLTIRDITAKTINNLDDSRLFTNYPNAFFPTYLNTIQTNFSSYKTDNHIIGNIFSYNFPITYYAKRAVSYKKFSDMLLCNRYNTYEIFNIAKKTEVNYIITSLNGMILDSHLILMVLTTNDVNCSNTDETLMTEKFRLYVDINFSLDEKYKVIFKKIYKDYILLCKQNGIEVLYTTQEKINKEVFSNNFKLEFNNVSEFNKILEEKSLSLKEQLLTEIDEEENLSF